MKIGALVLSSLRIAAFGGLAGGLAACGGSQGKLAVDTPILKYKQPDIDDITGADEDMDSDSDTDSDAAGSAAGSGSAAATPATPAPATPRK